MRIQDSQCTYLRSLHLESKLVVCYYFFIRRVTYAFVHFRAISRISETIPVLYVCGNHDIGDNPTIETLNEYRRHFGADYYGFWFGGVRCIVINSCLMMKPDAIPSVTEAQDRWFEEELEQAKLCAQQVLIFSHHPWFLNSFDEDEGESGYW
jgi:hypothetical protein